jgi:glycosyltransferase involved in cell wall biosynthesis
VLVHVGRFASPKNHALLVEAFAQVRADAPLYLLLVGGGELENAVREQVARLGLQERVRFLGVRADVPALLNASDLFVLSSRVEGNPLSVLEAMAAGLPVVSTAVGGRARAGARGRDGAAGSVGGRSGAGACVANVGGRPCTPRSDGQSGAAARHHAL